MKLRSAPILGLASLLLLGGCATSRSVLDIPSPGVRAVAPAGGKEVFVAPVLDRRAFAVNPPTPDIPSLAPDEDQSDSIKARAVGRKRNSWGKALGDILLKEGQSVQTLVARAIRQAFAEKGYRVAERKEDAAPDALRVEAAIDKFWTWMNPGMWALTLSTEISTALTLESPAGSNAKTVSVKASGSYQTGLEENYAEVIARALRLYAEELKAKIE
jgi:uncharacterized lipoprotein YajG